MNLKSTSEINLKNYPKKSVPALIIQTNSFVITKKLF